MVCTTTFDMQYRLTFATKDYRGQRWSELLYYIIVILFGVSFTTLKCWPQSDCTCKILLHFEGNCMVVRLHPERLLCCLPGMACGSRISIARKLYVDIWDPVVAYGVIFSPSRSAFRTGLSITCTRLNGFPKFLTGLHLPQRLRNQSLKRPRQRTSKLSNRLPNFLHLDLDWQRGICCIQL